MANETFESFKYLTRVRFSECDPQGVVFNSRYLEYLDVAINEYLIAGFGSLDELASLNIDFQVISANINWRASAEFRDVVCVSLETTKIGKTSFTMRAEFSNYSSGLALAVVDIVTVTVDAAKHSKVRVPDELREKLKSATRGVVVDHAGVS